MRTELLPVKLTEDELLYRGDELAKLTSDIESLEDEAKGVAAGYKEQIKTKKADASRLALVIQIKSENRDVEVSERPDYTRKRIDMVRLDTGAVYNSRPMSITDQQEAMFGDDRHEGKITVLGGN